MIPLERYMASLMPLQKNLSPYKGTPLLKPFNPDDFLATLDTAGPQLTTGIKGDWANLYRKFFRSRNFHGWYQTRHREVGRLSGNDPFAIQPQVNKNGDALIRGQSTSTTNISDDSINGNGTRTSSDLSASWELLGELRL